jgi:hypothetical protein
MSDHLLMNSYTICNPRIPPDYHTGHHHLEQNRYTQFQWTWIASSNTAREIAAHEGRQATMRPLHAISIPRDLHQRSRIPISDVSVVVVSLFLVAAN